jgi:hypothetical protein
MKCHDLTGARSLNVTRAMCKEAFVLLRNSGWWTRLCRWWRGQRDRLRCDAVLPLVAWSAGECGRFWVLFVPGWAAASWLVVKGLQKWRELWSKERGAESGEDKLPDGTCRCCSGKGGWPCPVEGWDACPACWGSGLRDESGERRAEKQHTELVLPDGEEQS